MSNRKKTVVVGAMAGGLVCAGLATAAVGDDLWSSDPIRDGSGLELAKAGSASATFDQQHRADRKLARTSKASVSGERQSTAAAKRGPRGKRGKRGPAGPAAPSGPAGPAGAPGSLSVYTETSPIFTLYYEDAAYYVATCTRGGRAISGGFRQDSTYYAWANESAPQNTSEWFYYITNNSSVYDTQIYFVTTCAL